MGESEGKAARSIQEHSLEIQNTILPIDRSIDQSINQDSEFRGKDVELDEELASPPGLHVTPKRQGVIASREECAEGLGEILRKTICTRLTERTGSPGTMGRGIQRRARACLASRRNTLQRSRVSERGGAPFVPCCGSIGSNGPDENKEFIEEIIL